MGDEIQSHEYAHWRNVGFKKSDRRQILVTDAPSGSTSATEPGSSIERGWAQAQVGDLLDGQKAMAEARQRLSKKRA